MAYKIIPTDNFVKSLKKIGRSNGAMVMKWVAKNLENTENPRVHGKPLRYELSQYWR